MSGIIKKIYVSGHGDSSVGIQAPFANIETFLDYQDDPEQLEFIRLQLKEAFSHIFDERVCVGFDFEAEAYEKAMSEGVI